MPKKMSPEEAARAGFEKKQKLIKEKAAKTKAPEVTKRKGKK